MVMLSLQQTNIYVAYFLYCCVSYVDRLPLGSIAFIWIGGYQLVSILMILICTVLLLCKLTIIVTAKPSFMCFYSVLPSTVSTIPGNLPEFSRSWKF